MVGMVGYDLRNLKILVVEKQALMRRLLGDVLRQLGVTHTTKVGTIDEALEVLSYETFDLIMLDWAPDMDALSLLGQVRNLDASRDPYVPVIVVSAYSEYMQICQARDAGMTEYLVKPISAKGLYRRITSIIERHRSFIQTETFFGPDRRRRNVGEAKVERRRFQPVPVSA